MCYASLRHLESKLRLKLANLYPFAALKVVPINSGELSTSPIIVSHPILIAETISTQPIKDPAICISTPYGQASDSSIPTIELWTLYQRTVKVLLPTFSAGQYNIIKSSYDSKPITTFPEKLSVPSYLTSQFGHFIGDCLGQILYFAHNPEIRRNMRLLITYPSDQWLKLLLELCPPGSLYPFHPSELLPKNLSLPAGSILLPRFSPIQNLIYSNYYVSSYLHNLDLSTSIVESDRVFFTSLREDRISNISEVVSHLKARGFTIMSHTMHELPTLLHCLSTAKLLLVEQGSIHQNVLISRNKPYFLLASESSKRQSHYEANCGGIYTSYHAHLIKPLYYPDISDERNLHPYSRPITVNLNSLDLLLC